MNFLTRYIENWKREMLTSNRVENAREKEEYFKQQNRDYEIAKSFVGEKIAKFLVRTK